MLNKRSYVNPFETEIKPSNSKKGKTTSGTKAKGAGSKTSAAKKLAVANELFNSDVDEGDFASLSVSSPPPTAAAKKRRAQVFPDSDADDEDDIAEAPPLRASALRSFLSRRVADGDYVLQADHTKRGEFYIECRLYNTSEIEPPALKDPSQRWKLATTTFKCAFDKNGPTFKGVVQLIAAAKEELRNVQPITYPSNTF